MRAKLHLKKWIGASLFLFACTQVDVSGLDPDLFTNSGNGGGSTDALCDDVDSTFSTKVLPIFASQCNNSGCHGDGSNSGGLNLDDGDNERGDGVSGVIGNIKAEGAINAFSSAQSALLLKPLSTAEGGQGGSHTGGEIFANTTDPDYETIFCWIEDGAKNDLNDSSCTFGEHVYPVFRKRGCTDGQCHDSNSPGGNMDLSQGSLVLYTDNPNGTATFADATLTPVFTAGDANSLLLQKPLNAISHGPSGNTQVFSSTQDPEYQIIKCWIDENATNN